MDSGNRYPPQDENAPNNADTEFFRPPQTPEQRPPFQQGQYPPPNGQGQPQIPYGYGQQQSFSPGQFQSAYVPPQPPLFNLCNLKRDHLDNGLLPRKGLQKLA